MEPNDPDSPSNSASDSLSSLSYNPDNGGGDEKGCIDSLWGIHESLDILRGTMSSQRLAIADTMDEMGDEQTLPPTYIVLQINGKTQENTVRWLVEKIRGKRRDGGAELIVMRQPYKREDGYIFHISASKIKFLETAEELEMIKEDRSGQMREFTVAQLEDFLKDDMHDDDLLTMSERQTIVRHELENIRALPEESHIPGYVTYSLYEGQSILQVCEKWGIVGKCFPLHDEETLKKLGSVWYWTLFTKQPIEEIRMYFGESIALYFTFLGFYTSALLIPTFLGFLQLFVSRETIPFFCIFNVVWVTVFLEVWKRRSNALAFKWGTIIMTSLDEPRPNFRGTMGIDAVTGKIQPQYTRYFTYLKMYGVSFPIVFLCLVAAFALMLLSFFVENFCMQVEHFKQFAILPSIIYTILVFIINMYYRRLATFLTEWENHRTQSQYDRHRVTKLVLFEFVNNFMSLFYIAFVIRDMDMLRSQLQIMLIISQAINNIQEAVLPLALRMIKGSTEKLAMKSFRAKNHKIDAKEPELLNELKLPQIHGEETRIRQAQCEGEMEDYEGTYDDYLELFIQFGYVFLFSSVYPVAAFWAVLNNVLEIRADAFKLCKIFQRPMCRRVKDIGAWQKSFEVLGALSIVTNCGVLYLSSPQISIRGVMLKDMEWLMVFVFLEHILLGIRFLLHITISDKPEWVRVALARRNYESKQALKILKIEKLQRNRKLLTRKFKTIHGTHGH